MSTRLYTPTTTSEVVSLVGSGTSYNATATPTMMTPFKTGTPATSSSSVQAVVASWTAGQTVQVRCSVSNPIVGSGVLSGSVRSWIQAFSPASSNAKPRFEVYVVSNDGATLRAVALARGDYSNGAALQTTVHSKVWALAAALTPVPYHEGDRIVCVWGITDVSGTTPTATLNFGDPLFSVDAAESESSTVSGNAWVEFSRSLDFYAGAPRVIGTAVGSASAHSSTVLTPVAPIVPTPNALQVLTVDVSTSPFGGTITVTGGGFTWAQIGANTYGGITGGAQRTTLFRAIAAAPNGGPLTINYTSAVARDVIKWVEIINPDDTGGSNGSAAVAAFAPNAIASTASTVTATFPSASTKKGNLVLAFSGTSLTTPVTTGEQTWGFIQSSNNGAGLNLATWVRQNYDQNFTVTYSGTAEWGISLLEINVGSKQSAPDVTPITPTPPGPIATTATITIDVTDRDGDLDVTTIQVLANGVPVYVSNAFTAGYSSSTAVPVVGPNGVRLALVAVGGWPAGSLGITVSASDARGVNTFVDTAYTVTPAVVHSPVITLVSPASPGAIGDTGLITVDITDLDGDLVLSTVIIRTESTIFSSSVYQVPFTVNSTRTTITNGFRFVFRADTAWAGIDLAIFVEATDAGGRRTTAFFVWSPLTHPASNPPVITLVSPAAGTIAPTDAVTIDVTDADNDLTSVLGVLDTLSEVIYSTSFGAVYVLSAKNPTTNGFRFIVRRNGGWPLGPMSITFTGQDSEGNSTTRTFLWTVAFADTGGAGDVLDGGLGADDPPEDLFFDNDFELDGTGDLLVNDEPEAVRQEMLDRIRIVSGEFGPRPEIGASAKQAVLKKRTKANIDEFRARIIDNLQQMTRLERLISVDVDTTIENGLRVSVTAFVKGQQKTFDPFVFTP